MSRTTPEGAVTRMTYRDGAVASVKAVSYTHLDVYKRQVMGAHMVQPQRLPGSSGQRMAPRLRHGRRRGPVSYTHLANL